MKKYYMIHDVQSGLYLQAMPNIHFVPVNEAETWPTEQSAEEWLLECDLGGSYIIILPVYM